MLCIELQVLSPYRAVNTRYLGYKTSQLMLYREIIAVCSEIHTKHISTLCGQNVYIYVLNLVEYVKGTEPEIFDGDRPVEDSFCLMSWGTRPSRYINWVTDSVVN
jgi:hypothetical protein